MTKPHEETWSVNTWGRVREDGGLDVFGEVRWPEPRPQACVDVDRARLAAQAPAMARLLLDLQWSNKDCDPGCIHIDGGMDGCPSCGAVKPWTCIDHGQHGAGHEPDCDLVSVLRAAGVIE